MHRIVLPRLGLRVLLVLLVSLLLEDLWGSWVEIFRQEGLSRAAVIFLTMNLLVTWLLLTTAFPLIILGSRRLSYVSLLGLRRIDRANVLNVALSERGGRDRFVLDLADGTQRQLPLAMMPTKTANREILARLTAWAARPPR